MKILDDTTRDCLEPLAVELEKKFREMDAQDRPLWVHRNVAASAMEVGAVFGLNDLEAIRHGQNGWNLVALGLQQTGHANLATAGAPELFVPLVGHRKILHQKSRKFHGPR